MSASIKDAKPGERFELEHGKDEDPSVATIVLLGQTVAVAWCNPHLIRRNGQPSCGIDPLFEFDFAGWRKTHNADGTPYEEPPPLPEFGECWAERDRDGVVILSDEPIRPDRVCSSLIVVGKIAFRPDLPWDRTACKVRVRLEVAE